MGKRIPGQLNRQYLPASYATVTSSRSRLWDYILLAASTSEASCRKGRSDTVFKQIDQQHFTFRSTGEPILTRLKGLLMEEQIRGGKEMSRRTKLTMVVLVGRSLDAVAALQSLQDLTMGILPWSQGATRTRRRAELQQPQQQTIVRVQISPTLFANKHVFYTDSRSWNFMQRMHK